VLARSLTGLNLDERFSATVSGVTESYLTDALGSIVALANAAGTTLPTTYAYSPFGATQQSGTTSPNPFQFTGRENDPTGLYYLRARYYNPTWSRFISEDPIGLSGGGNLYAYVGNNPVSLRDSLGLNSSWSEITNLAALASTSAYGVDPTTLLGAPTGQPPFIGPVTAGPTQGPTIAYRYYGGSVGITGQFLTTDVYSSPEAAIRSLALPPGNTATLVSRVTIPPGTQIQIGTVAPAFNQPGGGTQIQLLQNIAPSAFEPGVPIAQFNPTAALPAPLPDIPAARPALPDLPVEIPDIFIP